MSEQGSGLWAHSACALWLPDITLEHPDTVSGVQLDGLSGASADLKCGACHQVRLLPLDQYCLASLVHWVSEVWDASMIAHLLGVSSCHASGGNPSKAKSMIRLRPVRRRAVGFSNATSACAGAASMSSARATPAISWCFASQTAFRSCSAPCTPRTALHARGRTLSLVARLRKRQPSPRWRRVPLLQGPTPMSCSGCVTLRGIGSDWRSCSGVEVPLTLLCGGAVHC